MNILSNMGEEDVQLEIEIAAFGIQKRPLG